MSEVTLWLDTNVAWSAQNVRTLGKLALKKGVRVVVHAHVYLENWRQMRVEKKEAFSAQLIITLLKQYKITVFEMVLSQTVAERWGELLAKRYPAADDWSKAKLRSIKARLDDETSIREKKPPMTTDWLVALAVESRATQRFNEDDLVELKARGCLAEVQGAKRVTRPCQLEDEAMGRRQQRIVAVEDRDRGVVVTVLRWGSRAMRMPAWKKP